MHHARPIARLLAVTGVVVGLLVHAAVLTAPGASADEAPPATSATTPTIVPGAATTPTLTVTPPSEASTSAPVSTAATPAAADPTATTAPSPAGTPVASSVPAPPKRPTRRGPADLVIVDAKATGPVRIEVDISAQRLLLYRGRTLARSLHVSTGSGRRYCVAGDCAVAHTPRGRFHVYTRVAGWRTSRLGQLYNPLYFNGGYAIHGAGSVPAYPASHGCVRISMANARWLPSAVPDGTPVWVHD